MNYVPTIPSTEDRLLESERLWLLPALAAAIANWFPEVKDRSMAVSDVTIDKQNMPKLPLVMCAFAKSMGQSPRSSTIGIINMEDTIIVEFWMQPKRYKNALGETPFWSYYPYEVIRDRLISNVIDWRPPNGERLSYRSMVEVADPYAVVLTFNFSAVYQWCANSTRAPDQIITAAPSFGLCIPQGLCPPYYEPPT
jgi:hypothetical protein